MRKNKRILWGVVALILAAAACNLPTSRAAQHNTPIPSAVPPTEIPTITITPTAAPTTVHLPPGGSGEYAGLLQAVESVAPGSTIILAEGTYEVSPYLVVTKPITLQGAGMDKTFITTSSGLLVAEFHEAEKITLTGITFQHNGPEPADVVVITDGMVTIDDCRFTGGVYLAPDGLSPLGSGLQLYGQTDGVIANSTFNNNGNMGLDVSGDSTVRIESNTISHNDSVGLIVSGTYSGEITLNSILENAQHGLAVMGNSTPTITTNSIYDNASSGIIFFDNSSGTTRGNTCENNVSSGILVDDNASPLVENNTCSANQYDGFSAVGSSKAVFSNNSALKNVNVGFGFYENATGSASGNTCAFNGWGIYVEAGANPALESNNCYSNTSEDILDKR